MEESRLAALTGEIIGAKFQAELIRETLALLTEEDKRRFALALLEQASTNMDNYRAQDYAREAVKDIIVRLVSERHGERLRDLVDGVVEAHMESFVQQAMAYTQQQVNVRLKALGGQIESYVRSHFNLEGR